MEYFRENAKHAVTSSIFDVERYIKYRWTQHDVSYHIHIFKCVIS
jgi:hypothetical protein